MIKKQQIADIKVSCFFNCKNRIGEGGGRRGDERDGHISMNTGQMAHFSRRKERKREGRGQHEGERLIDRLID